jgi:hypothetical protein
MSAGSVGDDEMMQNVYDNSLFFAGDSDLGRSR